MPLGPVIAAGAAIGGAVISASATSKAAKAATNSAAANNALQTDIYNQNKDTLAPYVGAGTGATEQLRRLLGLGDSNTGVSVNGNPALSAQQQQTGAIEAFKQSSPFQFQVDEGNKAVTSALGARGFLDSGAAQKALLKYGQNTALTSLNSYQNNLFNLAGMGQSAASAQAGVGQSYAGAVGANNNNASTAVGNAALTNANTINGVLGAGLNAYGQYSGMQSSYGTSANGTSDPWALY